MRGFHCELRKCLANCSWCYKGHSDSIKNSVTPEKGHLSLNEIKKRIEWISAFTSAEKINVLGGEPLLHPNFKEVLDFILEQGLVPAVITAAAVSDTEVGRENIEVLFEYWERGLLDINLSFQPKRNEEEFVMVMQRMRESLQKRQNRMSEELAATRAQIKELRNSDAAVVDEVAIDRLTIKRNHLRRKLPDASGTSKKFFVEVTATIPKSIVANSQEWKKQSIVWQDRCVILIF